MAGLEQKLRFMKYMLDANALIALLSGNPPILGQRASNCYEGEIVISAIAFGEVALGSWLGKHPSMSVLDQLAQRMAVLPFDQLAAKHYAQIPFKRGSYNRLIAAHALACGLILVTSNTCDFSDIPALRVENWMR